MRLLSFFQALAFAVTFWAGAAYASAPTFNNTETDKWWLSLIMASFGVLTVVIGKVKAELDVERKNMLDRQRDPSIPPYIPMTMAQWAIMVASQSMLCWMAAAIFYFLGRHWGWAPWLLPAGVALAAMGGAKSIELAMNKVFPK